jgi:hypothetical protein
VAFTWSKFWLLTGHLLSFAVFVITFCYYIIVWVKSFLILENDTWNRFRSQSIREAFRSIIECHAIKHGLRTPNDDINQRYLKNWADVADKICFGRTYRLGIGIWFSAVQWRWFLHRASVVRDIKDLFLLIEFVYLIDFIQDIISKP